MSLAVGLACPSLPGAVPPAGSADPAVQALAAEVRDRGWLAFSAHSDRGDWDLFGCRPDGSELVPLTRTPDTSEFAPQFSRDGRRLLYRRVPRAEVLDRNRHGEQGELVLANRDGSDAVAFGKPGEFTWASWGPDGRQIACLSRQGISFVDVATRSVVRRLPRQGMFQQLTWSPEGRWLVGVANAFGTGWSVARMDAVTGQASAVNTVDCCTPDWSPDARQVIFSWRPPGQPANGGYGWTQLWLAEASGASRRLVYGEDGRHVYGGHLSPDGRYVLFTGNAEEDGDPGNAGAPMGLMRLADAPIIGGESRDLRALHPNARNGPVLPLPTGWEPCWTAGVRDEGNPGPAATSDNTGDPGADAVRRLAEELRPRGWIAFSARTEAGDWDLFRVRPDGSDRAPLTVTPAFNEGGVRFSPDGTRLLYHRMPATEPVDNNTYGTGELVVASANGSDPVSFGTGHAWASWGPDGRQIACLTPGGVQVVDLATRQVVRQYPRRGIVSQLVWSPDGRQFVGTANGLGPFWNIGCLATEPPDARLRAVSETDRYNCTPDWFPDGRGIVYARGIVPERGGRAELWWAPTDGAVPQPLYAEAGRHIYGGCVSPDGAHLLFTRSIEDLGRVDHTGTTMAIIRRADALMIGDADPALRQRLPGARTGPRLDLGQGWEPHWTRAQLLSAVRPSP